MRGVRNRIEVGAKFGKWTTTGPCFSVSHKSYTPCICTCGLERNVWTTDLIRGSSNGCTNCNQTRFVRKHGESHLPEYSVWKAMVYRCTLQKNPFWKHYGGRGIAVSNEWLGPRGYENFIKDMGYRPTPKHTIERKDNDGNYCPDNCCWATRTEQNHNTRRQRQIVFNGQEVRFDDWAEAILDRMRSGWSPESIMNTPLETRK